MEAGNQGSLGSAAQGFQREQEKTDRASFSHGTNSVNGARFLDLLARQGIHLQGARGRVKCPFHHGESSNSFSVDVKKGVFHCFSCGAGGGVRRFAELTGEPWATARPSPRAQGRDVALAAVRQNFLEWERSRFCALTDEYRELEADRAVAEIGFRAITRRPELYSEGEREFWTDTLATIYDRTPILESELDISTYRKHAAERFALWAFGQTHEEAA